MKTYCINDIYSFLMPVIVDPLKKYWTKFILSQRQCVKNRCAEAIHTFEVTSA